MKRLRNPCKTDHSSDDEGAVDELASGIRGCQLESWSLVGLRTLRESTFSEASRARLQLRAQREILKMHLGSKDRRETSPPRPAVMSDPTTYAGSSRRKVVPVRRSPLRDELKSPLASCRSTDVPDLDSTPAIPCALADFFSSGAHNITADGSPLVYKFVCASTEAIVSRDTYCPLAATELPSWSLTAKELPPAFLSCSNFAVVPACASAPAGCNELSASSDLLELDPVARL